MDLHLQSDPSLLPRSLDPDQGDRDPKRRRSEKKERAASPKEDRYELGFSRITCGFVN